MSARRLGVGVVGGRSFVATAAVMPAIDASSRCRVAAVASNGGEVPRPWRSRSVATYADVIDHPDVDAVYVPLPNGLHRPWAERAARAGKHVLCEKPLATDAAAARSMAASCRSAGVLLAEAWMTPFDPRWAAALELVRAGAVGDVEQVEARFTFTLPASASGNYRWDPAQGGGALLDVGIYCLGAAVELWGASPTVVSVERVVTPSGVDATTAAELAWATGGRATVRCSFVEPEQQLLAYTGTEGRLVLDGAAFTGGAGEIRVERAGGAVEIVPVVPDDPYRRMVDAFAAAVCGDAEWPRSAERSIDLLALVDEIGAAGAPRP